MSWDWHQFDEDNSLTTALCAEIDQTLRAGIEDRGHAVMAVSGGSTPLNLFRKMSALTLPWAQVTVTLVDERWVPVNHDDSNAALVLQHLLQGPAQQAQFIGLTTADVDPHLAEPEVNTRLAAMPQPFDVALLGMGEDGHTASYFPAAPELSLALDPPQGLHCCAISPPKAPHLRMTLTLPVLLASRRLFLHILGDKKAQVLEQAMVPGPVADLPVRAVLHQQQTLLEIYGARL